MSLVLLASGGSLLLLAAGTMSRLVDDAYLQDLALREEATAAAVVTRDPCALHVGTRARLAHPRVQLQEEVVASGPLRLLRLHAQWRASAMAGGRARDTWSSTAGWCE